jgi:hypothetical protein
MARQANSDSLGDGEEDDELDIEVTGLMSSVMDSVSWLRSEVCRHETPAPLILTTVLPPMVALISP